MSHKFLVPILTAVFLVAPAVLPRVLVAMAPGLSGAVQAAKNLNSSRSNIYRTTRPPVTTPKAGGNLDRMGGGGGGGGGGGAARMGGGGGSPNK
jgi:hypothetical protein